MLSEIKRSGISECEGYFADSYSDFILIDVESGGDQTVLDKDYNHLIIVQKGRLLIEYNDYKDSEFCEGEIVFIPTYVKTYIQARSDSQIIIASFEMPYDVYSSKMMESLWELRMNTQFKFASLPIRPPMKIYLDLLNMYLKCGINCARLNDIKEKEIFLLFRWFYTDQEFVQMFYPIVGKSVDLRSLVLQHYRHVKSVEELAEIVGMSRSNFDIKFKEIFAESPKQWMLARKAKSVKYYMSKSEVSIKDVMYKYGFNSFTQFNRFCKQYFGASPSEIIRRNTHQCK